MPRVPVKNIPRHVMEVLTKELNHTQEQVWLMSPEEIFDEWCNYQGLINWGSRLWEVMCALKGIEK